MLHDWSFANQTWQLGKTPKLMGIVNVTPDSFSDGGSWLAKEAAVEHALELVEQGADILDIGGESTRPGAEPVPIDEELRRVIPVIEALSQQTQVPISIDTMKAQVAKESIQAGAVIVNDVTACTFDAEMPVVVADSDCGVIIMHMLGTPQTMQNEPTYEDCVGEIHQYLNTRADTLVEMGVGEERIMYDPGIGFGKTADHNLELLSSISQLRERRPVLIGHSRKRFLAKVIGRPVEERLAGTIGVSVALAQQGADILRVHDVAAVRDAITAFERIINDES